MAHRVRGGRSVWLISPAMEIALQASPVQHVAFAGPLRTTLLDRIEAEVRAATLDCMLA
jgi:hypothetical protein